MPLVIALPCTFYFISFDVDATHAPTNHQMIWSTSYHHVTVLAHRSWHHLLFTNASVHRCQVITQLALHTCNRSIEPSLVMIFSTLITWLHIMSHMQWAPSSHMCELCNKSKPFHLHGISCSHMYLWTNHMFISLKHILVHLRLSLNYQNQTKTFQVLRFSKCIT